MSTDVDFTRIEAAQRKLADCDTRLAKYRAALDADADPVVVAGWMAEVQAERLRAEREITLAQPAGQYTTEQIRELVAELGSITNALADADPKLKAQVYEDLGITVTYDPTRHVARIESRPANPWATVSVGGSTSNFDPRPVVVESGWSELANQRDLQRGVADQVRRSRTGPRTKWMRIGRRMVVVLERRWSECQPNPLRAIAQSLLPQTSIPDVDGTSFLDLLHEWLLLLLASNAVLGHEQGVEAIHTPSWLTKAARAPAEQFATGARRDPSVSEAGAYPRGSGLGGEHVFGAAGSADRSQGGR